MKKALPSPWGPKTIKDPWKMPKWMTPYRELFVNTGGNSIEDMMNGDADPFSNLPLSTLQACVKSEVLFLERLHDAGLLACLNKRRYPT